MKIGIIGDRNHPGYGLVPDELFMAEDGYEVVYRPKNDPRGRELWVDSDKEGRAVLEWKNGGRCWVECDCGEHLCGIHGMHVLECDCPPLIDWDIDPYGYIGRDRAVRMMNGEYLPWTTQQSSLD